MAGIRCIRLNNKRNPNAAISVNKIGSSFLVQLGKVINLEQKSSNEQSSPPKGIQRREANMIKHKTAQK